MSGGTLDTALADVRRTLRVLRQYVRIGWIRKSQFRLEFVNQVLMDVVFYVSFVLTFEFLFSMEGGGDGVLTLAGWTHAETRLYLGFAFITDAVMMTFLGQMWHFGADLKDGKLDPFRTKPGSTAFLYLFQRFSPEGLTNLVIACGWLAFAFAGLEPGAIDPLRLLWALPLGLLSLAWVRVFLSIVSATFELYILNSDLGHLVSHITSHLSERPLDVYPGPLQRFLQFVFPVAATAWYPASLVLGKLDPLFAALYPLVLLAFGWAVLALFRRGLGRYESAMG